MYDLKCKRCENGFQNKKRTALYCSKECFSASLSEQQTIFSDEHVELIKKLRSEGNTLDFISKELGCCKETIHKFVVKYNLYLTKEEKSKVLKSQSAKKVRTDEEGRLKCNYCKERKFPEFFGPSSYSPTGKRNQCKSCVAKNSTINKNKKQKKSDDLFAFACAKSGVSVEEMKRMFDASQKK